MELHQPNRPGENLSNNSVVCILQDFQKTSNFLFYLSDSSLPDCCAVEFTVSQYYNASIKNILMSSKCNKDINPVSLLAIISSAVLTLSTVVTKLYTTCLILTSSHLIVTQDKIDWLLPDYNILPVIASEQTISNLIKVVRRHLN